MRTLFSADHARPVLTRENDIFFGRTIDDLIHWNFFQSPHANIVTEGDRYTLEIAVPGMGRKDITVAVEDNVMKVSGRKATHASYSHTSFMRSFTLPADADTNNIRAKCREGLLTIHIPRVTKATDHRTIRVEGDAGITTSPLNKAQAYSKNLWTKICAKLGIKQVQTKA